jgi:NADH-quinone oxidoreductase subunit J
MSVAAAFFYLFSAVMIASAFMVIAARNPVHSVLFLILAFVNASGLFLLLGAEFLAMILVVVYVGAVAVLLSAHRRDDWHRGCDRVGAGDGRLYAG